MTKARAPLVAAPVFCGSVVRELILKNNVLANGYKMPAARHFEPLAAILALVQNLFAIEGEISPDNAAKRRAKDAAGAFLAALDEIELHTRSFLLSAEKAASETPEWLVAAISAAVLRDRLAEIEQMRLFLSRAIESDALQENSNGAKDWKQWAPMIMEEFAAVIEKANPGKRIGFSAEGPAAKFMHAIIPLLTGQRPKTVQSVGTQLKEICQ